MQTFQRDSNRETEKNVHFVEKQKNKGDSEKKTDSINICEPKNRNTAAQEKPLHIYCELSSEWKWIKRNSQTRMKETRCSFYTFFNRNERITTTKTTTIERASNRRRAKHR